MPKPSDAGLGVLVARLGATAEACAELGIGYVAACVPSKLQVVTEGSPVSVPGARPWLEELIERIRDIDELEILDLLPVLRHARRHGPGYQRSDCDWNDRGAFFVARALLKEAATRAPDLGRLPMTDLFVSSVPDYRGQLADATKLQLEGDRLVPATVDVPGEEGVAIDHARLRAERMPVERHLVGGEAVHVRLFTRAGASPGPSLSIVGDEACLPVFRWLAEGAGRTTFFWSPTPPMEPIELELPDFVFHLIRYGELPRLAQTVA